MVTKKPDRTFDDATLSHPGKVVTEFLFGVPILENDDNSKVSYQRIDF